MTAPIVLAGAARRPRGDPSTADRGGEERKERARERPAMGGIDRAPRTATPRETRRLDASRPPDHSSPMSPKPFEPRAEALARQPAPGPVHRRANPAPPRPSSPPARPGTRPCPALRCAR